MQWMFCAFALAFHSADIAAANTVILAISIHSSIKVKLP